MTTPSPEVASGPLSIRDFRNFFVGQGLSTMGDSLVSLALAFAVLDLTSSPTTLGLVLLGSRLPMILFALLGGSVGDRFARRSVLLASDLGRVVVQLLAGWLLLTGRATPLVLGVLAALAGIGSAFFQPAAAGLMPTLVPPELLQPANAALGATRSVVQIGAIALSGVLVAFAGAGWAFVVDGLSFAASAVFISLISKTSNAGHGRRAGLVRGTRTGWQEVRSRPWLWLSIMHIALTNMLVIAPFLVLGPYIAARDLGGATSWAALGTAAAIGGLLGNLLAARWSPQRPLRTIYIATLAMVPLLVLLSIPAPVWLLAPAAAIGLAQNALFNVVHSTMMQRVVPNEVLATVTSIAMLGTLVAVPVGLGLAGPVAEATSTTVTLTGSAAWVIVAGVTMAFHPASDLAPTSAYAPGSGGSGHAS